jgi:protein-L-isoaspartate(D-aspartate) O-methyltransferase
MSLSSIFHRKTSFPKNTVDHLRERMVQEQIFSRGIKDEKILDALRKVPRHLFIPTQYWDESYEDHPLPIGEEQTISQPYIVAYMTEVLHLKNTDKVLEIGTGCGYQTAILAELSTQVYSIEYYPKLANQAKITLDRLGYSNVKIKQGNGHEGWKEYAPFDAIIVTCAPQEIPQILMEQLADGGRMIIPIGNKNHQELYLVKKQGKNIFQEKLFPVIFVPMLTM